MAEVMRFREKLAERTDFVPIAGTLVFSPSRITLENNGKIRPQPDG